MMTSSLALMAGISASGIMKGTPIAGRYWRVLILANQGAGTPSASSADKIEMRSSPGGSNLATNPTSAISSSEFGAGFINDFAFDATSNYWVSADSGYETQWIGYDFGSDVEIQEIVWSKRPDSFGQNEAPTIGLVQYSPDLSNWTTSWVFVTPSTWGTGAETRTFTKVAGAQKYFWRIRPTAVQGGPTFPFSAAEIEMRTSVGGADQTTGGYVFSSAFNNSFPNFRAFDGNVSGGSNFALSAGNVPGGAPFIGYTFLTPVEIVQIVYQVRGDSFGANEAIIAADVESSIDRLNWTTEWSFTFASTWVNNSTESRVATKP